MNLKKELNEKGKEDYIGYDLPKFVMFSSHDSKCGAFIGFMKAVFGTEIIYPTFANNINLELYKKDKVYYVDYIINEQLMKNLNMMILFLKFKIKEKVLMI